MMTLRNTGLGLAALISLSWGTVAKAAVDCQITDFNVQAYESGTTYLYGVVGGNLIHLYLCTAAGATNPCDSTGTARNFALAMTALTSGRPLWFNVSTPDTCATVPSHIRPTVWYMK